MRPRAVICGSFHRSPEKLRRLFKELEMTGCRVLSPLSLDFSSLGASVVKTDAEFGLSTKEIESLHLRAIQEADFVFMHSPDGYVGLSSALEIGFATANGKPVFSKEPIEDETLGVYIKNVNSVFEALEIVGLY